MGSMLSEEEKKESDFLCSSFNVLNERAATQSQGICRTPLEKETFLCFMFRDYNPFPKFHVTLTYRKTFLMISLLDVTFVQHTHNTVRVFIPKTNSLRI